MPSVPPVPPAGGPEGSKEPTSRQSFYNASLGSMLNKLFSAAAAVYDTTTQDTLRVLNAALNDLALAQAEKSKELGKKGLSSTKIWEIRGQMQTIQGEIQSTNTSLSTIASSASTMASILNKVVSSLATMERDIASNL